MLNVQHVSMTELEAGLEDRTVAVGQPIDEGSGPGGLDWGRHVADSMVSRVGRALLGAQPKAPAR